MSNNSVIDVPVNPAATGSGDLPGKVSFPDAKTLDKFDSLRTGKYAHTLATFIGECQTPMTVGVQGEWGSGKTSLLQMITYALRQSTFKWNNGKTEYSGADSFKLIWINTWEQSLLKSPEECFLGIIESIIEGIVRDTGSWKHIEAAKGALASLAKGAIKVGASMSLGLKAGEVADELLSSGGGGIAQLREQLEKLVNTAITEQKAARFVIFVDDLDRVDPEDAVRILELLKNIFNVPHCVFVVAIDYQVVVKGLRGKFGAPTPDNEWEFRAFFDKIIQLPFMMPTASYELDGYIEALFNEIGYSDKRWSKTIVKRLASAVKLTVGHNPRSLKRLINSLSLIEISERLQNKESALVSQSADSKLRSLVFILICMQISFPKVYELLLVEADFIGWDDEFYRKATGGLEESKEIADALQRAASVNEADWDEKWEQVLFKVVWGNNWQRSRLGDLSRLLSMVKDEIYQVREDEPREAFVTDMANAIEMTKVTAVASTEGGVFNSVGDTDSLDQKEKIKKDRRDFWGDFDKHCISGGEKNILTEAFSRRKLGKTYASSGISRVWDGFFADQIQITISCGSTTPLRIEAYAGDNKENYIVFAEFRRVRDKLLSITNSESVDIVTGENASRHYVAFRPSAVEARLRLEYAENKDARLKLFKWLNAALPGLEEVMREIGHKVNSAEKLSAGSSISDYSNSTAEFDTADKAE